MALAAPRATTPSADDPGGLRARLVERRGAVLAAAARHGAGNVRVFGSVARGDHRADSDIDLVVDFEPGRGMFDLGHLTEDLCRVLGVRVDAISVSAHRPARAACSTSRCRCDRTGGAGRRSGTRPPRRGFDWRGLVGMRNVVVHRYPDLNDDLVWAGVEEIAAFAPPSTAGGAER